MLVHQFTAQELRPGWNPTISLDELVEANRRLAAIDNQYRWTWCQGHYAQRVDALQNHRLMIRSTLHCWRMQLSSRASTPRIKELNWPQRLVEAFMSPARGQHRLLRLRPRRRG